MKRLNEWNLLFLDDLERVAKHALRNKGKGFGEDIRVKFLGMRDATREAHLTPEDVLAIRDCLAERFQTRMQWGAVQESIPVDKNPSNKGESLKDLKRLNEYNQPSSGAVERLYEIAEEIEALTEEALRITRDVDYGEGETARGYWYAHIMSAVGSPNYPTRSRTLLDTAANLDGSSLDDQEEMLDDPDFY